MGPQDCWFWHGTPFPRRPNTCSDPCSWYQVWFFLSLILLLHGLSSRVRGLIWTRLFDCSGYMAPEYLMHGNLSKKADVFSFGVVVLELISGQKNSSFDRDPDSGNLIEWVRTLGSPCRIYYMLELRLVSGSRHTKAVESIYTSRQLRLGLVPFMSKASFSSCSNLVCLQAYKLYRKQRSLEIMDPVLVLSADTEQISMLVQIGLLCVQSDPQLRPAMDRVVVLLSRRPSHLEEPTRPGVPGSRYRRYRTTTTSSVTGNSDVSSSGSFGSTTSTATATATASTSSLAKSIPRSDRHGKRPIIG